MVGCGLQRRKAPWNGVLLTSTLNRQEELERIGRERLAAEREVERALRRRFLRALAEVAGSCAIGMVIMAFAFSSNDRDTGMIFLWGGMLVGYSGMAYALLSAFLRAERDGDI